MKKIMAIVFVAALLSGCNRSPNEIGDRIIKHCENADASIMHKCLQDSIFVLDQLKGM